MKTFQTVQKCLALEGYSANGSAFNRLQLWVGFKCTLALFAQCAYLFLRLPKTPKEYMDSIFMTTVGILVFISFVSTVFKTAKIFELINKIEMAINESEFTHIFRLILLYDIEQKIPKKTLKKL